MHHQESEAGHNHNHYRMSDNLPVTPHDLHQHLEAFAQHEKGQLFLNPGEVERINAQFEEFYAKWTAIDDEGTSPEQRYLAQSSQKFNEADLIELRMFGIQQEPCRISADELKVDYERARAAIEASLSASKGMPDMESKLEAEKEKIFKEYNALIEYRKIGGSRGIGSERAMTRQVEGSEMPAIPTVAAKDDALDGGIPSIPKWALGATGAVKRAEAMIAVLEAQLAREQSLPKAAGDLVEAVISETSVQAQVMKKLLSELKPESVSEEEPSIGPGIGSSGKDKE